MWALPGKFNESYQNLGAMGAIKKGHSMKGEVSACIGHLPMLATYHASVMHSAAQYSTPCTDTIRAAVPFIGCAVAAARLY